MKRILLLTYLIALSTALHGQTNHYTISFENAVHHEGVFKMKFSQVTADTLNVRMANSSPGRYAFHSFAKNVYNFKAFDENGKALQFHRPNPYQWDVFGHNGTVLISYTLFANRGDGTYAQIDETHAHLNIPASFMFAPSLKERPIEVTVQTPENSNWKVATQLQKKNDSVFWAPDLYYFMDSPLEISNHTLREFQIAENGKTKNIRFALHHDGTEEEFDEYFESVKRIVLEQQKIFGELPDFDFDEYTFLACYMPNVNGDGMEHRNSTVLTSTRSLAEGGMKRNLGTVSHEFFHAWNVERIRPKSLEPFDFDNVDMSGELWFAEGFTSYYTNLTLCRAGLITPEEYVKSLNGSFNYVWNSNGRKFFNPIEMSYQAPFVDAATSLDPQNRNNTFISYYSYGSMLGLALDHKLRQEGLSLDGFFEKLWAAYGSKEKPYTIADLQSVLAEYVDYNGIEFSTNFFNRFIYNSQMPDYKNLFSSVGMQLNQNSEKGFFGAKAKQNRISENPLLDSPAYQAGLVKGDLILSANGIALDELNTFSDFISRQKKGTLIHIFFERFGNQKEAKLTLTADPIYQISIDQNATLKAVAARKLWLER